MNFPSKLLTQTFCFANRLRATADWHAHGCGTSPQTSRRCNGRLLLIFNNYRMRRMKNKTATLFDGASHCIDLFVAARYKWDATCCHRFIFFFSPRCGCEATTPMKLWQIKWDDCRERGSRRSGCLLLDGSMLFRRSRSFLRNSLRHLFPLLQFLGLNPLCFSFYQATSACEFPCYSAWRSHKHANPAHTRSLCRVRFLLI